MCDAASAIMVGAMLAGTAVTVQGQRKAADAAKDRIRKALASQESLRKKALGQSEQVVNDQGAESLAEQARKPQEVVNQEGAAGDTIAQAFAKSAGIGASDQGRIIGAATGAKRTATNEATRSGFSRALQARLAQLGNLTTNNLLLGEDSRRISAALPWQLEQAGQVGANQRLIGGLISTGAQGAMSNRAWGSASTAGSTAGMQVPGSDPSHYQMGNDPLHYRR